jgi:agmatine deiminase
MLADHQANSVYVAGRLQARFPRLWRELEQTLLENGVPLFRLDGAKDLWLRDFLPVQVTADRFVQFRYEPDYLEDGYGHLITDAGICRAIPHLTSCRSSDINLDGGNVVAGRNKAILTDKVFQENPQHSPRRLLGELRQLLQVEEIIIIPREPGDPLGHSDGIARLLHDDLAVINDYSAVSRAYGKSLRAVLKRHRLEHETVPYFIEDRETDGIPSAMGCYVNFLRVGQLLIVPAYGAPADDEAVRKLEVLCPGALVVPLRCVRLARRGGVLHCASWNLRANLGKAGSGKAKIRAGH